MAAEFQTESHELFMRHPGFVICAKAIVDRAEVPISGCEYDDEVCIGL